jgi:hypothetical protein
MSNCSQLMRWLCSNPQEELQPSRLAVLPSSHCSPGSRMPLPQTAPVVVAQTPPLQMLLWHWSPAVHADPIPSLGAHAALVLQKKPVAQFRSLEQVVGQALVEHTKGAHATVAQVPTLPGRLHACAAPPEQLLQLVLQQTP